MSGPHDGMVVFEFGIPLMPTTLTPAAAKVLMRRNRSMSSMLYRRVPRWLRDGVSNPWRSHTRNK